MIFTCFCWFAPWALTRSPQVIIRTLVMLTLTLEDMFARVIFLLRDLPTIFAFALTAYDPLSSSQTFYLALSGFVACSVRFLMTCLRSIRLAYYIPDLPSDTPYHKFERS